MKPLAKSLSRTLILLCLFCTLAAILPLSASGEETPSSDDDDFDFMEEEFGESAPLIADPLAPLNKVCFKFNDRLYFWVLKPVATGYRKVMPGFARTGINNFFDNLRAPIRIAASLMQLKGKKAAAEGTRFFVNSSAGILGFGNPAKQFSALNPTPEDTGQTLASYGIGNGFYIVLPFMGPSTLRDAAGSLCDAFLDPVTYVRASDAYVATKGVETINTTAQHIGDYETLKKSAIKPYEAIRDFYVQHRKKLESE